MIVKFILSKFNPKHSLFFFVLVLGFLWATFLIKSAHGRDWEPLKGEYKRLLKDRVFLFGKIVCLFDVLKYRPGGADIGTSSENINVLRELSGKTWHLVDTSHAESIRRKPEWQGHTVRLFGWRYEDARAFEIDTCTIISSDGSEIPLRFCSSCQNLVPEIDFNGFQASATKELSKDVCHHCLPSFP